VRSSIAIARLPQEGKTRISSDMIVLSGASMTACKFDLSEASKIEQEMNLGLQ